MERFGHVEVEFIAVHEYYWSFVYLFSFTRIPWVHLLLYSSTDWVEPCKICPSLSDTFRFHWITFHGLDLQIDVVGFGVWEPHVLQWAKNIMSQRAVIISDFWIWCGRCWSIFHGLVAVKEEVISFRQPNCCVYFLVFWSLVVDFIERLLKEIQLILFLFELNKCYICVLDRERIDLGPGFNHIFQWQSVVLLLNSILSDIFSETQTSGFEFIQDERPKARSAHFNVSLRVGSWVPRSRHLVVGGLIFDLYFDQATVMAVRYRTWLTISDSVDITHHSWALRAKLRDAYFSCLTSWIRNIIHRVSIDAELADRHCVLRANGTVFNLGITGNRRNTCVISHILIEELLARHLSWRDSYPSSIWRNLIFITPSFQEYAFLFELIQLWNRSESWYFQIRIWLCHVDGPCDFGAQRTCHAAPTFVQDCRHASHGLGRQLIAFVTSASRITAKVWNRGRIYSRTIFIKAGTCRIITLDQVGDNIRNMKVRIHQLLQIRILEKYSFLHGLQWIGRWECLGHQIIWEDVSGDVNIWIQSACRKCLGFSIRGASDLAEKLLGQLVWCTFLVELKHEVWRRLEGSWYCFIQAENTSGKEVLSQICEEAWGSAGLIINLRSSRGRCEVVISLKLRLRAVQAIYRQFESVLVLPDGNISLIWVVGVLNFVIVDKRVVLPSWFEPFSTVIILQQVLFVLRWWRNRYIISRNSSGDTWHIHCSSCTPTDDCSADTRHEESSKDANLEEYSEIHPRWELLFQKWCH